MTEFIRLLVNIIIIIFLVLVKYVGLLIASTIFVSVGIIGIIIIGLIVLISR